MKVAKEFVEGRYYKFVGFQASWDPETESFMVRGGRASKGAEKSDIEMHNWLDRKPRKCTYVYERTCASFENIWTSKRTPWTVPCDYEYYLMRNFFMEVEVDDHCNEIKSTSGAYDEATFVVLQEDTQLRN